MGVEKAAPAASPELVALAKSRGYQLRATGTYKAVYQVPGAADVILAMVMGNPTTTRAVKVLDAIYAHQARSKSMFVPKLLGKEVADLPNGPQIVMYRTSLLFSCADEWADDLGDAKEPKDLLFPKGRFKLYLQAMEDDHPGAVRALWALIKAVVKAVPDVTLDFTPDNVMETRSGQLVFNDVFF